MNSDPSNKSIVIVGGGAGGLVLATRLARKFRNTTNINVHLVDKKLTHIWKPLLHEVAVGTLDVNQDELNYIAHANRHDYLFQYGEMIGLNRKDKTIELAAVQQNNKMIIAKRTIGYDVLVLAIGSVAHTFSIPGADEHCFFLDSLGESKEFQQQFIQSMITRLYQPPTKTTPFSIAVIGGGATGIELAAEITYALSHTSQLRFHGKHLPTIKLIEAHHRLLPQLPEKISTLVTEHLHTLGINIHMNTKVSKITEQQIITTDHQTIDANLKVWVAGVKAPDWLKQLEGLDVNALNQLVVKPTLQTTEDDAVFALGDCACAMSDGKQVPPRAQAAHQQADFLAKAIPLFLKQQPLPNYQYIDYGSLFNLSGANTIGALMGKFSKTFLIQGFVARMIYLMLYKMHLLTLHGWRQFFMVSLSSHLTSRTKPRLKLH